MQIDFSLIPSGTCHIFPRDATFEFHCQSQITWAREKQDMCVKNNFRYTNVIFRIVEKNSRCSSLFHANLFAFDSETFAKIAVYVNHVAWQMKVWKHRLISRRIRRAVRINVVLLHVVVVKFRWSSPCMAAGFSSSVKTDKNIWWDEIREKSGWICRIL